MGLSVGVSDAETVGGVGDAGIEGVDGACDGEQAATTRVTHRSTSLCSSWAIKESSHCWSRHLASKTGQSITGAASKARHKRASTHVGAGFRVNSGRFVELVRSG